MISYLDEQVGELISKLKELGIYKNTVILFTSDNGASYAGGAEPDWFNSGGLFNSEYGRGKGFLYEGGIRIPLIASWPGQIEPNSETNHISAFWDLLPTICEISKVTLPSNIDGTSFLPSLVGEVQEQPEYLYFEFPEYGGQQAVRLGNMKAIRKDIKKGNMEIELYDLEKDIQEQVNIADKYPDIIKQVEEIMLKEHTPSILEKFKLQQLGDI